MSNIQSLTYFLPELILVGFVMVIILADVFFRGRGRNRVVWLLSLAALGITAVFLLLQATPPDAIFYGALAVDPYSRFFKWIFLLATAVIYIVSPYTRELDKNPRHEYYLFMLLVVFGLFLMASAGLSCRNRNTAAATSAARLISQISRLRLRPPKNTSARMITSTKPVRISSGRK